ncbi:MULTISPECIES: hypothetical protein [unclassified Sphingomonas]|uniref:hypothetical protein n=1 Tax=unclassified Sphingomonas TaxID=196159 RepID=UPI00226ACC39|nr:MULTISPECIES: hypothetical protein [unclassified Sphingomonas]
MRLLLCSLGTVLLLGGCGHHDQPADNNAAAAAFVPPPLQAPTPLPGQGHSKPISAYVGHYPTEAVEGVTFYDRTEVANALVGAVGDDKIRRTMTAHEATTTPIFQRGPSLGAHGCEAHNCSDHNWTLLVRADGNTAEACYHDASTMGNASRWYAGGAPATRPGDCPSE